MDSRCMGQCILNKLNYFNNDYRRLKDFQKSLVNKLIELIKIDPEFKKFSNNLKPCHLHELRGYSHGNWKVMSLDVPEHNDECNVALLGYQDYARGEIRLVYEYTYTTNKDLVITLCNCSKHNYKTMHYSESN